MTTAVRNGDSDARPTPLAALPFRVVHGQFGGHSCVELEYEGEVWTPAGMKRQPFRIRVGDATVGNADALGLGVVRLIEMYRTLEAKMDGLTKDRDEALSRATVAEGDAKRAGKRADEFERRAAGGRKGG